MKTEISAAAALAVQNVQRKGYRGPALLHDPFTRQVVLFRVEANGCECIAHAHAPGDDLELGVVELPQLVIDRDLTPDQAFAAAEAEIHRSMRMAMN